MLFRIVVAQFLGTARVANLAQCLCFNLPDAFAGDVELLANFLQRVRLSILLSLIHISEPTRRS